MNILNIYKHFTPPIAIFLLEVFLLRFYDKFGYVVPHCACCMEELELGQETVLTEMNNIIHAKCRHLTGLDVTDCGEFSEVIARNFHIFQYFLEKFNEMGVYDKK